MKTLNYYEELAESYAKDLVKGKQKKRTAQTLSDKDKDKVFVHVLNNISEEERLRVLLYCAKRGFIAYR